MKTGIHAVVIRAIFCALLASVGGLFANAAWAWNSTGHRIVAAVAWEELDAPERKRLATLLRAHPHWSEWVDAVGRRSGEQEGEGEQGNRLSAEQEAILVRAVFMESAVWADAIRRDERFHDDDESPTPRLNGYPDMLRHKDWHYMNLPVGPGASLARKTSKGVLERQIVQLAQPVSRQMTKALQAYRMVWLVHLVGDLHQPLHVVSRYDHQGEADEGGNQLEVSPVALNEGEKSHRASRKSGHYEGGHRTVNLHSWWDDLPGPSSLRGKRLEQVIGDAARAGWAAQLQGRTLWQQHVVLPAQVAVWREESHRQAVDVAYRGLPLISVVRLSEGYQQDAARLAQENLGVAGLRLARLLKDLLR